ncbi:hypothetical protein GW17_00014664 [Ensete ventricosum]|nr:hypothetical protein GW17_00014664 [Ensete ventricosum]
MSNGGIATCAAFLLVACVSMCFMLYLTVTPLKSATDEPETEIGMLPSRMDELELSRGRKDDVQDKTATNEDLLSVESALENTLEHHNDKSFLDSNIDQSDTAINPDHDCHQPTHDSVASDTAIDADHDCRQLTHDSVASDTTIDPEHDCQQPTHGLSASDTFSSAMFQNKESKSVNEVDLETMNKTSSASLFDRGVVERQESDVVQKGLTLKADISRDKDNEEVLVSKESVTKSLPPSTSEDSGSSNPVQVKVSDGGIGSESSSKSSGLGRSSRRQLAIILDEFWGHLFDFHGKPTQEAIGQKYDTLLGLNLKTVSSIKVDVGTESSINFCTDDDRGTIFSPNSMDYGSPKQMNMSKGELSYGFQMGSPSRSRNIQILNTPSQGLSSRQLDSNERPYSSLYLPQCSDNHDYQPATVHGYQIASYLKEIGSGRTPYLSKVSLEAPKISKSPPSIPPGFEDSVLYGDRQNGLGSLATSSLQSPKMPRVRKVQVEGPYFNPSLIEPSQNAGSSSYTKKYHSSPDISALIAASRNSLLNEANSGGPIAQPSLGRMISQQQHYLNPISKTGVSLAFDELYPPKLQRDVLPLKSKLNPDTRSLWSRQPFEQLFGMPNGGESRGDRAVTDKLSSASEELLSFADSELKLLQSLCFCITKLLKLEGSDWLFRHNGGCDEQLICKVSTTEKYMHIAGANDTNQLHSNRLQFLSSDQKLSSVQRNEEADTPYTLSLPNCGDGCVWQASLVVSFGVWCVHRILELSLVESRPELWGKYTYGILDLAFSRPRNPLSTCSCLELAPEGSNKFPLSQQSKPIRAPFTTASMILEIIKDVEIAVSGRKGRTGTAAGDVAFPKGKENLASVLKRYKRRLSNRTTGTHEGSSLRKIQTTASVF